MSLAKLEQAAIDNPVRMSVEQAMKVAKSNNTIISNDSPSVYKALSVLYKHLQELPDSPWLASDA